ncbi:MAG: hypothetical protein JWL90_4390, partial [Chthoniobacteraceae bacterium]|nr:hypothetical protein [Chthoniobacteraceae bacterium]
FVPLPNRIERYDLATQSWLTPISLPSGYGALSTGAIDSDGIYVAYDKSTYRYNLNGANEAHILTTTDPVVGLHTDGGLLLINHSVSLYARLKSVAKSTNTVIASFENYIDSLAGSSIAPSINKIFGRSLGVSPADITYASYTDAGQFIEGGDSPHHGDYPSAMQTWVFPDNGRVVDDSGTIYSASSLTYVASFGGRIDDLAFYGGNIPIVARGSELIAYSPALLPTGSKQLGYSPKTIFISDDQVAAFISNDAMPGGIAATLVPLSALNPPQPGSAVDPHGVPYTPSGSFIDKDGLIYFFSKTHQSIFRWNPATQDYLSTIPLLGVPEYVAYSVSNHKIYTAYQSGLIRSIDLSAATWSEQPFAALPAAPRGLSTADQYVFATDSSGAWDSHYSFRPDGTLVGSVEWNYYSTEYIWNPAAQKMYFFRDDTSPNDLIWEEINANGTAYPAIPAGSIGVYKDSPLHTSEGFAHPIRISPNGSMVVLGSGVIHDAITLERSAATLANPVTDIAWAGNSGAISTIRTIAGTTQFQRWNAPTYGQGTVLQVPGAAHALKTLKGGTSLLGVTIAADGVPSFYVLDENFSVIAPSTLQAPQRLGVSVVAANKVDIAWADITGEAFYSVERKVGAGGIWTQIGTTGLSSTTFSDSAVSTGITYYYRVTARNGALASPASSELEVPVATPSIPATLTASALSSSEIQVTWSDVERETTYLLDRRIAPSGTWSQITTPALNVTSYKDQYLSSNTTYEYRVRAQNAIGASGYSTTASAKTNATIPSAPYLYTPTATSSYSVSLSWYNNGGLPESYSISRRISGVTAWTLLTTVAYPATSYTDLTVSPASTYQYMITATNSAGTSASSSTVSVITPAPPSPTQPAGFAARTVSGTDLFLTWTDSLYETTYRVERRLGEGAWETLTTIAANSVMYHDTTVVTGAYYGYRIVAVNAQGTTLSAEDYAVAENLVALYQDKFDPGVQAGLWELITGGSVNSGIGFMTGNALWFSGNGRRAAMTQPLEIGSNTYLNFFFRAGNEAVDGANWNNSEANERVFLDYSINGSDWVVMQTLATIYPNHSTWTDYSIEIPLAAQSLGTRFRWRQEAHSGVNTDHWAIENMSVTGPAPQRPPPPAFIIANANSSTAAAIFWAAAKGASSYTIERREHDEAWESIASVAGNQTYYTDLTVSPATLYQYRVFATNPAGSSSPSSHAIVFTWSRLVDWKATMFGNIDSEAAASLALNGNGVPNLLEFAFNMDPYGPSPTLASSGISGMPALSCDASTGRLRVELVRRKLATAPGIVYVVEFSSDLKNWNEGGIEVSVTDIDPTWERVVVEDNSPVNDPHRFGRVRVVE